MIDTIRKVLVCLAVTFAAGLLFVNIYNSLVDAPNWGADIPASIDAAKAYYKHANPGTFYRMFSPASQVIGLLALIACWTADKKLRYLLLAALIVSVSADLFTFGYFYPRNAIMFSGSAADKIEDIRIAHAQWSTANWLRSAICTLGLVLDFAALDRLISVKR